MEVCTPVPLICYVCHAIELIYYSTVMNVVAGLAPATTPHIWITDKFGKQYKDQVTVKTDGSFDITGANFPEGMFNPSAGGFDLFVSSDANGVNIETLTISGKSYNCITFSTTCT